MPQPIPYVIDFTNATMHTSAANDKIQPPFFDEILNIDISVNGEINKRYGLDDLSNNGSPDVPETRINAIAPTIIDTSNYMSVQADDKFYYFNDMEDAWAVMGSGFTVTDSYPWQLSWGIDSGGRAVTYYSLTQGTAQPVIAVDAFGNTITKYGNTDDVSNPWTTARCSEYFLDKLWVGATTESSNSKPDRLRWSVTGDDDDFYGSGSGFFDIRHPGGGTAANSIGISGLRVYQNRLWIAHGRALYVLTGTTSDTFGKNLVCTVNAIQGSTMYVTGPFMFWVDFDGIWKFNGRLCVNISNGKMLRRWNTLTAGEKWNTTASWDAGDGIYRVWFPTTKEQWDYHYREDKWEIYKYSTAEDIRVISPPIGNYMVDSSSAWESTSPFPKIFALGTLTAGKVFRYDPATVTDDGATITGSITTGQIRLAEMNQGRPGDHARLLYIDIETVQQNEAGVIKVDITIDGTAQSTASLTVADAGGSEDTFPTHYDGKPTTRIDLGSIKKAGRFFQFKFSDDDANSRMDLRRVTIWYERLENAGSRPA